MHRLALRAGRRWRRGHGAAFRYGDACARSSSNTDARRGCVLATGERIARDRGGFNADPQPLAAGRSGARCVARHARAAAPTDRSLSRAGAGPAARPRAAFRWSATMSSSSATMPPEFAELARGRIPRDPTRLCLRAGPRCRPTALRRPGPNACRSSSTPRHRRQRPLTQRRSSDAQQRDAGPACGARGLTLEWQPGDGAHDAERSSTRLFPRRVEPFMDRPRTGGRRPSAGRAAGRGSRASIARAGATHPGAGVPMAALSGRLAVACLLEDRASMARSRRAAMPGGMSTRFSADGRFGLTIIAFIGSVFSPYYKLSGRGRPDNHCAINVALYGPRGEGLGDDRARARARLARDADHFAVGPSALSWDGDTLVIDIAEISRAAARRVRGTRARAAPRHDRHDRLRARSRRAAPLASGRAARAGRSRR